MRWQDAVFKKFRLYAVTDAGPRDPKLLRKIEAAYRGGADIVQLRSKTLTDREIYELGLSVRKIADRYRKLFFVNDRPDLALALAADGVHVGQDDLPLNCIRRMAARAGKRLLIGKSTHSLWQARAAVREGADYVGVGPVFKTPTKKDYIPVGLGLVRRVCREIKVPFVAIGGIDEINLRDVLGAGATRVAMVRAIFCAKNTEASVKRIKEEILRYAA